jgi:hypothetical protein
MKEFTKIRQDDRGFRRLFYDDSFDLYVWYTAPGGPITGFQLVYNSKDMQKALTWTEKEGFIHTGIDEGDRKLINQTPMLVQDGVFEYDNVYERLIAHMAGLESDIQALVTAKMKEYNWKT